MDCPAEPYQLTAELEGFLTVRRSNIEISVGQNTTIDVELSLAGLEETITTTGGNRPLINTSTGEPDITLDLVESLPTGRTIQDYLQMVPGGWSRAPVTGLRRIENAAGGAPEYYDFDFIQEMQVQTEGLSAEFVGATGLVSNVITKSGGNDFSGSFYYYSRDDFSSGLTPRLIFPEPGVSLGGPIIKDRLWFFGSFALDTASRVDLEIGGFGLDEPFDWTDIAPRIGVTYDLRAGGGRILFPSYEPFPELGGAQGRFGSEPFSWTDISPRLGFSYDLTSDGRQQLNPDYDFSFWDDPIQRAVLGSGVTPDSFYRIVTPDGWDAASGLTTFTWSDNDWESDPLVRFGTGSRMELGDNPTRSFSDFGISSADQAIQRMYNDMITVGISQEVADGIAVNLERRRRAYRESNSGFDSSGSIEVWNLIRGEGMIQARLADRFTGRSAYGATVRDFAALYGAPASLAYNGFFRRPAHQFSGGFGQLPNVAAVGDAPAPAADACNYGFGNPGSCLSGDLVTIQNGVPNPIALSGLPVDDRFQLFIVLYVRTGTGPAPGSPGDASNNPGGSRWARAAQRAGAWLTDALKVPGAVNLLTPPLQAHVTAPVSLAPGTLVRVREAGQTGGGMAASIVATGASSGEAFILETLSPTGAAMQVVAPDGLVLQAVSQGAGQRVSQTGGGTVATTAMTGFCLEYDKPQPTEGTLYQLAPESLQQQFQPMRKLLEAGRSLAENGLLNPDSEAGAYGTFIQQWSLWTKLKDWDLGEFTREFIDRTKKNVENLSGEWTNAMRDALRDAAPNRFNDITAVLLAADGLP